MKYIVVPAAVGLESIAGEIIKGPSGPLKISFREFAEGRLRDLQWGQSAETLMMAVEIRAQIRTELSVIKLETEHWRKLLEITNKPSPQQPYNPEIAHCIAPFIHAIQQAGDKPLAEAETVSAN